MGSEDKVHTLEYPENFLTPRASSTAFHILTWLEERALCAKHSEALYNVNMQTSEQPSLQMRKTVPQKGHLLIQPVGGSRAWQ